MNKAVNQFPQLEIQILVSLGTGRTFAVFQILGTYWVTKETFKICVITGVSSRAYSFENQQVSHLGQWQSFSHATMP